MKKQVIITGASSTIMDAVINLILLEKDYTIVGITRNKKENYRSDIQWVEADITSIANYSFLKDAALIIHAAAISNTHNKEDYFKTNYEATANLIQAAISYNVDKFVYISSLVTGERSGYYSRSKLLSEEYIKSNFNRWLIIRPSQLYGYSEKAPIDNLINKIKTKKIIPCPTGDPTSLMPIFYREAAQLIFDTIFKEDLSNVIKYITGPEALNYKGLINSIASTLNKNITIIPIPAIILKSVRVILIISGIKTTIYSDQITRLYHPPHSSVPEKTTASPISDYLKRG